MDSNINVRFGKAIAALRTKKGLSQEELAYRCGLHRTYIGAVERGEKSPTLNTVEKILKGLNININEIWEVFTIG